MQLPPFLTSLDARLLAPYERLIDGLCDPARRRRVALMAALAYAAVWLLYAIISRSSADVNPDMGEMAVWGRNLDWGYPKHPPLLGWVAAAWFAIFPAADWAFNLLAAINLAAGLYLAFELAGLWLDGPKRAAAPFLLAVVPFYNFIGLKFDQNSALIPLWAIATYALARSLDTKRTGWAVLLGVAGAAALLVKYWSGLLLLTLVVTALLDRERDRYFRSAAPYISAAVGALLFMPHAIWLVQNHFPPLQWVGTRRSAGSIAEWFGSLSEFSFGTVGYCGLALAAWIILLRPSLPALRDTLIPAGDARRRAALIFWLPLLVPVVVAACSGTNLLSLWNTASLSLLPVILLASPQVQMTRTTAARFAGFAGIVALGALIASPFVAHAILKKGGDNEGGYARLVMEQMQQQWRLKTTKPLKLIAGPFGMISTAAFYGEDRPASLADFSRYLSPWVTEDRIARQGLAIACPEDDGGCLTELTRRLDGWPAAAKSEVTLRRHWFGLDGPPRRFVIGILPPR